MKVCIKCGFEKDVSDFHRHPDAKDGYDPRCKQCKSELYQARSEKAFEEGIGKRYGLTFGEYTALLAAQEGRCLICHRSPDEVTRRFAVDHCHKTGKIRGILCTPCNSALGLLGRIQSA